MSKKQINTRRIIIAIVGLVIIALITLGVVFAIQQSAIPEFNDGSELGVVNLLSEEGQTNEWSVKIDDESIASVYDKTSSTINKDEGGVAIESHYIFKGKKPGKTKVTFKYGSFADGQVKEQRTYCIEVNRELQIKVIEE